jgi:hypothetical protein
MPFICPYCHVRSVPASPETTHPHALCGNCGKRPRAKISHTKAGEKVVKYVKDGRPAGEQLVLTSVRLYARQVRRYPNLSEAVRAALDAYEETTP